MRNAPLDGTPHPSIPWLAGAVLLGALTAPVFAPPAQSQVVPGPVQIACFEPVPVNPPPPALTPWFYRRDLGDLVWGQHLHYENPAAAVFSLARELVTVPDQPAGSWPEVILLNGPQFDPPEGIAGPGPRRLMVDSLLRKGIQLHVNYSGAKIAGTGERYLKPTFFLSIDGHSQNHQTVPPVPWSGFSFQGVAATRAAFGCALSSVTAHGGAGACDDLYVTAGLGYGLADLDPDPAHQGLAADAQTDRLLWRDRATGRWSDISQNVCPGGADRVPTSATTGNSSGVAFADFTGDGWADLYVGKPGDNFTGAKNVLLVNDGTGCFTDQTATRIPFEPSQATQEVAAADLDRDGDLDLVVANRCRTDGAACGVESEDYVLLNNGAGFFRTVIGLNPGLPTDTRSLAIGDLNHDTWPEIVFGNAGNDLFGNDLVLTPDHPMQILFNLGATGGAVNQFVNRVTTVLGAGAEFVHTSPGTVQVLLTDLFRPGGNTPDGWLDLVIVNHRDILKNIVDGNVGSWVNVLVNKGSWGGSGPFLNQFTAFPSNWVRTVAVADFDGNGFADVFQGKGNRFSGVVSDLHANAGSANPPGQPWDFNLVENKSYETMPGNEHGYGFDFADLDGDGTLDALQTSRGYDYLVFGLLGFSSADHRELTSFGAGTGVTSNDRGRLIPKGMEDGVFADFNLDGDLDALMASQRNPSHTWPPCAHASASPDTMLLVNSGAGSLGYDPAPGTSGSACPVEDNRIDLNGRTVHPNLADRAVAGDLDNDGDVDAIVHLFPAPQGSIPGLPASNAHVSFGWRFLRNVFGEPSSGGFWLRDEAATRMKSPAGFYDPLWNRDLGMDLLADFDNNGGLDLYTTVGFASTNPAKTNDLLFLNGIGGPKGVLTESSSLLPTPCASVVPGSPAYASCGSFGLAQGDVDNDGDADLVVTHFGQLHRTNYASLLINRLNEPTAKLVDEFVTRVPVNTLSPVIHTSDVVSGGSTFKGMDWAMFPALADLDADGDLDLVYQVVNDLPRVLLNAGRDSNGDGLVTAADTPPPGTFVDATATVLQAYKPSTDSQDLVALDLDRDGDFDLANDPFSDAVTFWRNDLPSGAGRPAVTEIWPRVGSMRRSVVRLEGVNLDSVVKVQFRYAGGAVCEQPITTPVGTAGTQLDVRIPVACPIGLAQVRVLRSAPACGGGATQQRWSSQYFGYFVLG
jgi:hypothetical protein